MTRPRSGCSLGLGSFSYARPGLGHPDSDTAEVGLHDPVSLMGAEMHAFILFKVSQC